MKIRINPIMFFLILTISLSAQEPILEWSQTYGGLYDDKASSVMQTLDSGYIIAGKTGSFGAGNDDCWLIKTDSEGNEIWNQTYGGQMDDEANSVKQTTDGGYIIAGNTLSFGSAGRNFWLVKTDSYGNELWNHTYDGDYYENAYSVQQTADGGYIIAGKTLSSGAPSEYCRLIKTDSDGNEIWNQTYIGENANSIQQTTDEGFIFAGSYNSSFLLVKTDSDGNQLWYQTYNAGSSDVAYSVQQTSDGGFILAGKALHGNPMNEYYDFLIVKTDSLGNELWQSEFGGDLDEIAYSVQQTTDGCYVASGYTQSFGPGSNAFCIVKFYFNGDILWVKYYGGDGFDRAFSSQQTMDEGFVIAGYTNSFGAGSNDFWLVKLEIPVSADEELINPQLAILKQNSPNPFNPSTTIELSIPNNSEIELSVFNIKGQKVTTLANNEYTQGTHTIIWNGDDESGNSVSSGIYFYKLQVNGKTEAVKKCLLLK